MSDPVMNQVFAALGLKTKPFGITIAVIEHSNGVVDQVIPLTEYSGSGPENVFKYQWLSDVILQALNGKNEAGSGGAFRQMGEQYQAIAAASGGDEAKADKLYAEACAAQGQGKPCTE